MPSGSHGGGGGGSHGGFSGGGGSHGGFSSSGESFGFRNGGVFRPRGPRTVIFFGGPRIMTSARQMLSSILIGLVAMMFLFLCVVGVQLSECNKQIEMIKEEQQYYFKMIKDAENNPDELQINGEVTSIYYKTEYNKYYYEYRFYDNKGNKYDGYTFSVYTLDNVPSKGDIVKLAIDDKKIDDNTDSIPMDYINFSLEDDGEYVAIKAEKKTHTTVLIVTCVLVVGALVGIFLVYATAKRKKEEEIESEKRLEQEKQETENKKKYCQYCGTKLKPDDRNCPHCGAKIL